MSLGRPQIVFKLFSNEPNARKGRSPAAIAEQYQFGPFRLDVVERELRRDNETVPLTAKTFDLLLMLVQGAGRTFTKSELMESLWPGTAVEEGNLSQTIFMLRKVLGENGGAEGSTYILTVPKRGYKFVGSVNLKEGGVLKELSPASPWPEAWSTTVRRTGVALAAAAIFAVAAWGWLKPRAIDPRPVMR